MDPRLPARVGSLPRVALAACVAALLPAAATAQDETPAADEVPATQDTATQDTVTQDTAQQPTSPPGEREPASPGEPAAPRSDRYFRLDTLVITPMRAEERLFDVPYSADSVSEEEFLERSYRTTPQMLSSTPGVMVQETSVGHGSPYIRGFTSQQNLFLIDGIRLNNSVFRPGPNQYWNTVDPFTLQRLELVKGPSSVLYGSDAIGGTVNAITKDPYAYGREHGFAGFLHYRVASAEESHTGRAEVAAALGQDTGLLLGLTGRHFGDFQGGEDAGTLPYTSYDEYDGDLKLEHFVRDGVRLVLAHQQVHQDDVPRTHSTIFAESFEGTEIGSNLRREFDQDRELTYAQLRAEDLDGAIDAYTLSLSWQDQEEVEDRVRGSGNRSLTGFDAETLGMFASFDSYTSIGRLSYGVEFYRDFVDSFTNRFDQQTPADDIQGPVADDATYDLAGVYLQDEIPVSERLDLTLGGRFNFAAADADSVRDPVTDERISIDEDWSELVGSARFDYELEPERWALFGGVSQGFRAPNLADLTRFDSARSDEFEIPAPDLDPEHFIQYELGVKQKSERSSAQAAVFYTDISDGIQRFPTGNVNMDGDREVTKANVGEGHIWGIELGAAHEVLPQWTTFGIATWLDSQVESFPTSDPTPVEAATTRQQPTTIQVGLRWDSEDEALWAETVLTWADDADELSPSDENDDQRIPPGGTPSYFVWDLRSGYRVNENVALTFAIENVLDEDYRIHGSGQNRPGTNAVLGASFHF